ncbi:uncharacterized protein EDB93DRAFT_1251637 [Suillus bovinus]|uniref:uncharacterized protein n=1 Tax=Suillus bovinus TaxID=48563 RepID=UPI001B881263|nr:uncharacterized protein EDB93DRAFT_1251637 [Suillus bovinus]KAG2144396.1 hypothetical protein EDB93DRAFT_1251637 [Suillus bovinus]
MLRNRPNNEKYWVVYMDHYKERDLVRHEFIILDVFDCGTNRPLFRLRAERRPSRRKPDEQKESESPPLRPDHLVSPSDDTISRLRENFRADDYDHLPTCQIFKQVEDRSWYYSLFRRQCYWFCTTFLKRVESKTGTTKIASRHCKRQGTPGYGYILGGRLKVLNEDKAKRSIERRNLEQEDQKKKQEDEDHEAMKTRIMEAMQRVEQERLAALETTRQAIQPLLITTQARQEAEVLVLRSKFLQIVAQPCPT